MTTIKLLEDRVAYLEKQIYGIGKTIGIDDALPENSVIDSLLHANTLISSALSGREKTNIAIKRLPELNNYLDPTSDDVDLPTDAKLQLLLTAESEIKENYGMLTKVHDLLPVLETDIIRNVPELTNKFNDLSLSYLKAYEEAQDLNAHVYEIFSKYNEVITSISKLLITLDATITAAEVAAMPKKRID